MQLHLDAGMLSGMSWPFRVTPPLLSTVDALTRAGGKMHGWGLAELSGETPPNVYRALERLRNAGWVAFEWEAENVSATGPRKRLYWLTAEGWNRGPRLLAERRGQGLPGRIPRWATRLLEIPGEAR